MGHYEHKSCSDGVSQSYNINENSCWNTLTVRADQGSKISDECDSREVRNVGNL